MNSRIKTIAENFENFMKKPEMFISHDVIHCHQLRNLLKNIYDCTKNEETKNNGSNALPELIVQSFDCEQIWQQLELQNEEFLTKSLPNVSRLVVAKDRLIFAELDKEINSLDVENVKNAASEHSDTDNESSDSLNDDQNDLEIASDSLSFSSDDDNDKPNKPARKVKPSIVDDQFFKLNEMETFLKAEEKKLNDESKDDSGNDTESDESVDLFQADEEEEGSEEDSRQKNPKYKDFFVEEIDELKKTKRNRFLEEQDEEDGELKSTLELREERLKKKIKHIEANALAERSWQLKGEITAENRPQNSLLEEIVEFDLTTRPAPVITEQTSLQLEDVIRQRIKDRVFDSVERKQKPVETPLEYKKKLVLNQEKSKESLAQIYEKEYLKQKEALDPDAVDKEEEEPQLHKEVKTMMHALFMKLDALSNFHFTPRMAAPELKIISNLPAINMEEVAPVVASDAALLAPEEVKRKTKGDEIGKSERTETDKKRERRKKKQKQKVHVKRKELASKQQQPGLGNKYSKEKAKKLLEDVTKDKNVDKMDESHSSKSVKSSTAFFKQLQDEVKSQIKNKSHVKKNTKKDGVSARKMKL